MSDNTAFFLPLRKGSQRVKYKNTRPFAGIDGGLLQLKMTQLLEATRINTIYVSTNDQEVIDIVQKTDAKGKNIKIIIRPDELCLDSTSLGDLISYIPSIIHEQHIIWGHVTTPFADAKVYDEAVDIYFNKINEGYDSLITVSRFQNFLFKPGANEIFNFQGGGIKWPRTQDLPLLYEVNHSIFIASRNTYVSKNDRIGYRPYFMEQDVIRSLDIDWEDDFFIAESIYEKLHRRY